MGSTALVTKRFDPQSSNTRHRTAEKLDHFASLLPFVLLLSVVNRGSYFLPQQQGLIVLSLCILAYLIFWQVKHGEQLAIDRPARSLLALSAIALASAAWSLAPAHSVWSGLLVLAYAIYYSAVKKAYSHVDRMFWLQAVSVIGAVVALCGVTGVLFMIFPWAVGIYGVKTAASFLEHPNALAMYALLSLPAIVDLVRTSSKDTTTRWLYYAGLQVMLQAIFLTYSRAGYLFTMLLFAVYLISALKRPDELRLLAVSFATAAVSSALISLFIKPGFSPVSLIVFMASLATYPLVSMRWALGGKRAAPFLIGAALAVTAIITAGAGQHALQIIGELVESQSLLQLSETHRLATWSSSIDAWRDRIVGGWGAGTFYDAYAPYVHTTTTKFAHNIVIQYMVETGALGGLAMTSFYFACLVGLGKHMSLGAIRHRFTYYHATALVCGFFLLQNLFDFTWYFPAVTLLFLANVAISGTGLETLAHHNREIVYAKGGDSSE